MTGLYGDAELASRLRARMRIPLIVGPMFLVSGPALVTATSAAGVMGTFPTLNARTPEQLDQWFGEITASLAEAPGAAPYAVNIIVHPTNPRLEDDLALTVSHRAPVVIASVGNPTPVIERVKSYGGTVLSDVASLKHARRASEVGVDGLILLCAGAGGHTGWLNPFAFYTAVREFFAGPIILAGAISNGRLVHVAERLGADFSYVGTNFIAASESLAADEYRDMLVASTADDIVQSSAFSGIPANMLRMSIERASALADKRRSSFSVVDQIAEIKAWRDVWSAGHGVGDVHEIEPAAAIVARFIRDYEEAARSA